MYLHYSGLNIVYRPKSDGAERVILEQGVLASPLDPQLEGRVTVEGSELIIKKVQMSDSGVFRVSDLAGFHVADIYINVVGKGRRHLGFVLGLFYRRISLNSSI